MGDVSAVQGSPGSGISTEGTSLTTITRAFGSRNYRLFFGGQGLSLVGTWMQQVAMSWLVYRLTNSPFLLGVVGFAGQAPTFLLTALAGVLADRFDRRRILYITQTLAMLQASILAYITLAGLVRVWHVMALSAFLGVVNAFDIPTRQSFVVEIVHDRADLGNAIAMNSFMFNSARLIGPSIAGVMIGLVGEGFCFLINAVSFLTIIIALMAMRTGKPMETTGNMRIFAGLKEGFTYAFAFIPIRYILFLLALMSVVGMPYAVLMPVFAKNLLHGGPHTLGFLLSASGIGAISGALYLASRKSVRGLGRVIVVAVSAGGLGLMAFSMSSSVPLSLVTLLFVGFGMMVHSAASNTILQTIVDEDKRGRVMSFFAMAFMGMAPFGSLLAGLLAHKIGAPPTLFMSGIVCLIGAAVFSTRLPLMRSYVRPIYVRMGIIEEMPTEFH
jgi:MFS family permease